MEQEVVESKIARADGMRLARFCQVVRLMNTESYLGLLLFCYSCIFDWQIDIPDCVHPKPHPPLPSGRLSLLKGSEDRLKL
jgi:hypothetical protein